MEKWIESQDRMALIEAKGLIEVCAVKRHPNEWLICCDGLWLGTYPTSGRTQAVLQSIKGFLNFDSTRVFSMPKE